MSAQIAESILEQQILIVDGIIHDIGVALDTYVRH
jgi:hypothetical protein